MTIKIKILTCFISAAFIMLSFCGCTGYSESDSRYIVSSIGFDAEGRELSASIEVVMTNSREGEGEETKVFSALGETPESAVYNLGGELSKPILTDHCGVVVLGETLDKAQIESVFSYCRSEAILNPAVYIITAKNAESLISCKSVWGPAVGYDIMGIIERSREENGISYQNRFYEADAASDKVLPVFSLPFFEVEEDKFSMTGERIFNGYSPVLELNTEESLVYSFITNTNKGGTMLIGGKKSRVSASHTYLKVGRENGGLKLSLNTRLKGEETDKEFERELKAAAEALIQKARDSKAGDIFGIAERIYKKDIKLWDKIKSDYSKIFLSPETEIKYSAGGDKA